MTNLTVFAPSASYGDLITTTNMGQGLTTTLASIQDGFGHPSPMSMATNAVNFNRGIGTFQLDGIALVASATKLNNLSSATPLFISTTGVTLPAGTTVQRPGIPLEGTVRYNTDTDLLEFYNGIAWTSLIAAGSVVTDVLGVAGQITSSHTTTPMIGLAPFGTPGLVNYPSTITTDLYGRVSAFGASTPPVLLTGSTMSGHLILDSDPVNDLGAATKQYVDAIAAGFTIKEACFAATRADLASNYNNGAAGVGATLTSTVAIGAFTVDGTNPAVGARILVKDQTLGVRNGIYTVTVVGDGIIPWVLTRATDYNTPAQIQPGNLVPIYNGTVNINTSWIQTATVTLIGTTPIVFTLFSAAGTVTTLSQGSNILLSTNPITVAGTVSLNPVLTGITSANIGAATIGSLAIGVSTIQAIPADTNIVIVPSGAGKLFVGDINSLNSSLYLADGGFAVGFDAPSLTHSLSWLLPNDEGVAGQFLQTDGGNPGILNWGDAFSIAGDGLTSPDPTIIAMPDIGIPGFYAYPSSITTDDQGRVIAVVASGMIPVNTVTASAPLAASAGPTPNISLNTSGVLAATYTNATVVVNDRGLVTSATNGTAPVTTVNVTAPITSTGPTVTPTLSLANSGVSAATFTNATITTDLLGRVTAASNGTPPVTVITGTPGNISVTGTTTPTLNLITTGVAATTFTNATITTDLFGRITAATNGTASVTTVNVTAPITSTGPTVTPTLSLANSGVTAATFTNATITTDLLGRVTAASNGTAPVTTVNVTAPITSTGPAATPTLSLANSGVSAATFTNATITTDLLGRVTAASNGTAPVTSITGTAGNISVTGTTTPTLNLITTGVTAGTYKFGAMAIDSFGRITSVSGAGQDAGTGFFIGATAGNITFTGANNMGVGISVMGAISSGHGNTVLGVTSGNAISTGSNNVILGNTSGNIVSSGGNNVILGFGAAVALTSGSNNVIIGTTAGAHFSNGVGGSDNTTLGNSSMTLGVGSKNTALGSTAGATQSSYTSCTFLGYGADASANTLSFACAIGDAATVAINNAMVLGGTSTANFTRVGIGQTSPAYTLHLGNIGAGAGTASCTIGMVNSTNAPAAPAAGNGVLFIDSSGRLCYQGATTLTVLAPA